MTPELAAEIGGDAVNRTCLEGLMEQELVMGLMRRLPLERLLPRDRLDLRDRLLLRLFLEEDREREGRAATDGRRPRSLRGSLRGSTSSITMSPWQERSGSMLITGQLGTSVFRL